MWAAIGEGPAHVGCYSGGWAAIVEGPAHVGCYSGGSCPCGLL